MLMVMQPQQYQPPTMPQGSTPGVPPPQYDFITSPASPPRKPLFSFGGQSLIMKLVLGGAALLVFIIVFSIVKNFSANSGNSPALLTVVQQQQELVHLAAAANNQQGISSATLNSSTTVSSSVASAQQQLISYMSKNHIKVKTKQLNLKISAANDNELSAAATAGNYDQTYVTIMTAQLNAYKLALKQAYSKTAGPKGKALLSSQFDQASLLLLQIDPSGS